MSWHGEIRSNLDRGLLCTLNFEDVRCPAFIRYRGDDIILKISFHPRDIMHNLPTHLQLVSDDRLKLTCIDWVYDFVNSCVDDNGDEYNSTEIYVNTLSIGRTPWLDGEPIKSARLSCDGAFQVIKVGAVIGRLMDHDDLADLRRNSKLFSCDFNLGKVEGFYSFNAHYGIPVPQNLDLFFSVEFLNGASLDEVEEINYSIRQLISCMYCSTKYSTFLEVVKDAPGELEGQKNQTYAVFNRKHRAQSDVRASSGVGGYMPIRCEQGLNDFGGLLSAWLNDRKSMAKARSLMLMCFSLHEEITADRILSLSRLLEELPSASPKQAIDPEKIGLIVEAANEAACEVGLHEIKGRLVQSIKSIGKESHHERFSRLASALLSKFELNIDKERFVKRLEKSQEYRGKSAHGHLSIDSNEEFKNVSDATAALELVCYLMLFEKYDLPKDWMGYIQRTEVVEGYLAAT